MLPLRVRSWDFINRHQIFQMMILNRRVVHVAEVYIIKRCCTDHKWHHCLSLPLFSPTANEAQKLQTHFNNSVWLVPGRGWAPPARECTGMLQGAGFCLEAQRSIFCLPASSHIKWRQERMDESPRNRHLYQPPPSLRGGFLKVNPGLFSNETQTEGKVITVGIFKSRFLHLLVAPSGLLFLLYVTTNI